MDWTSIAIPDLGESFFVFVLSSLILVAWGYGGAYIFDIFEFRKRRIPFQLLVAVVFPITVLPIFIYYMVHITSVRVTFQVFAATAILFYFVTVFQLIRHRRSVKLIRRIEALWAVLVVSAAFLVLLELNDIIIEDHLVVNVAIGDHVKHVLLTDAISREGVPPINPSFNVSTPPPAAYYYFEAMIASVLSGTNLDEMSNGRNAFTAITAFTFMALAAVSVLYVRLTRNTVHMSRYAALIGLGLLNVSGFDIIPALLGSYKNREYIDVWNWKAQVTSWHASVLWVPQHVTGMIACVLTLLLFQAIKPTQCWQSIAKYSLLAAFALASAVGLSLWVTLVFAIFWIVYIVILLVKGSTRLAWIGVLIAVLSLVFAAPFLIELLHSNSAGFPIEIRPLALDFKYFKYLDLGTGLKVVSLIVSFGVMYGLEFGFFALAGIVFIARGSVHQNRPERTAEVTLLITSLLMASFLRSTIMYNDLGWRAFLLAQFVLLAWGIDVILSLTRRYPILIGAVIVAVGIGGAGRAADVVLMRTTFSRGQPTREMFYVRETYLYLRQHTSPSAIIQQIPGENFVDTLHGLYSDRQPVMTNLTHAIVFGTPQKEYRPVFIALMLEFLPENANDLSYAQSLCADYHIDYLVFKRSDPIWRFKTAWIWNLTPWFETPLTRVFSCEALLSYQSSLLERKFYV